jgi:hypothetical protein
MRFLTLLLILFICTPIAANDVDDYSKECRSSMNILGQALKTALKSAMEESGPKGALNKCNVDAVPITETVSIESGMLVGRTSFKNRSIQNIPDEWESKVLKEFEKKTYTEFGEIVTTEDGHQTFRYMKAIYTLPLCLKCHGSELEEDVALIIKKLYPKDKATGYKVGDFRGAFTIQKPLN